MTTHASDMNSEIWRDVPGFKGLYQVSSVGQVKRLSGTPRTSTDRILKQNLNGDYFQVALSKDGKAASYLVHRLVCWAFIGEQGDWWVNHKNGDKSDNHIENLEYVTPSENTEHAYRTGLRRKLYGAENPNARVTEDDEYAITTLYLYARFETGGILGIARLTGIPYSTVHGVIQRYLRGQNQH